MAVAQKGGEWPVCTFYGDVHSNIFVFLICELCSGRQHLHMNNLTGSKAQCFALGNGQLKAKVQWQIVKLNYSMWQIHLSTQKTWAFHYSRTPACCDHGIKVKPSWTDINHWTKVKVARHRLPFLDVKQRFFYSSTCP